MNLILIITYYDLHMESHECKTEEECFNKIKDHLSLEDNIDSIAIILPYEFSGIYIAAELDHYSTRFNTRKLPKIEKWSYTKNRWKLFSNQKSKTYAVNKLLTKEE